MINYQAEINYLCLFRTLIHHTHYIPCFWYTCTYVHLIYSVYTVNIALNKQAYQQYLFDSWNNVFNARNAVDGQKSNLTWQAGQCAISANHRQTATWWVNLTSIHSIHHITIYFKTNNRFGKVTVITYLGNDSLCGIIKLSSHI